MAVHLMVCIVQRMPWTGETKGLNMTCRECDKAISSMSAFAHRRQLVNLFDEVVYNRLFLCVLSVEDCNLSIKVVDLSLKDGILLAQLCFARWQGALKSAKCLVGEAAEHS